MARRVALDHNFPEPILKTVAPWLPEVELRWIREIDPGFPDLEDHDLLYALRRTGFAVLVTGNWKMVRDARVLVALVETRSMLLTIQGGGDDAILATGVLLRDLTPALRANVARGQVLSVRPTAPRPRRARDLLTAIAEQQATTTEDLLRLHGRSLQQRQRPPAD